MAPENSQLSAAMLWIGIFHLLPTWPNNEGDDDKIDDGFIFEIDPRFLVDLDKLTILEEIGATNDSIVHEGWYEDCLVAVKIVLPRNTKDATPERKKRFQKEVNLKSRVQHKNIVKFIGVSVEPSMMIITELVEGGSLQKNLRSMYPMTLDLEQSLGLALDISQAMEYLHDNGIIHHDLNPGNLLLTKDNMHVKLADFGIARDDSSDERASEDDTNYQYVAPEVWSYDPLLKGEEIRYDHMADVYSFAIVLWSLIKHQIPFDGMLNMGVVFGTINNVRPSVEEFPQFVVPLIQSCWAKDPKLRPEFKEITEKLWGLLGECVLLRRETALARISEIEIEVDNDNDDRNNVGAGDEEEDSSRSEEEHHSIGSLVEKISQHDVDDGTETVKKDSMPKKKSKLKRLFSGLGSCFVMPSACMKKHDG